MSNYHQNWNKQSWNESPNKILSVNLDFEDTYITNKNNVDPLQIFDPLANKFVNIYDYVDDLISDTNPSINEEYFLNYPFSDNRKKIASGFTTMNSSSGGGGGNVGGGNQGSDNGGEYLPPEAGEAFGPILTDPLGGILDDDLDNLRGPYGDFPRIFLNRPLRRGITFNPCEQECIRQWRENAKNKDFEYDPNLNRLIPKDFDKKAEEKIKEAAECLEEQSKQFLEKYIDRWWWDDKKWVYQENAPFEERHLPGGAIPQPQYPPDEVIDESNDWDWSSYPPPSGWHKKFTDNPYPTDNNSDHPCKGDPNSISRGIVHKAINSAWKCTYVGCRGDMPTAEPRWKTERPHYDPPQPPYFDPDVTVPQQGPNWCENEKQKSLEELNLNLMFIKCVMKCRDPDIISEDCNQPYGKDAYTKWICITQLVLEFRCNLYKQWKNWQQLRCLVIGDYADCLVNCYNKAYTYKDPSTGVTRGFVDNCFEPTPNILGGADSFNQCKNTQCEETFRSANQILNDNWESEWKNSVELLKQSIEKECLCANRGETFGSDYYFWKQGPPLPPTPVRHYEDQDDNPALSPQYPFREFFPVPKSFEEGENEEDPTFNPGFEEYPSDTGSAPRWYIPWEWSFPPDVSHGGRVPFLRFFPWSTNTYRRLRYPNQGSSGDNTNP